VIIGIMTIDRLLRMKFRWRQMPRTRKLSPARRWVIVHGGDSFSFHFGISTLLIVSWNRIIVYCKGGKKGGKGAGEDEDDVVEKGGKAGKKKGGRGKGRRGGADSDDDDVSVIKPIPIKVCEAV